jgi:hypothetical protein
VEAKSRLKCASTTHLACVDLGKGPLVAGTAYTCGGAQPFSREVVAFFLRFDKSREMWRSLRGRGRGRG